MTMHGLQVARRPDWETRDDGGDGEGEGDDPIAEIRTAIAGFTTTAETRMAALDTAITGIGTRLGEVEKVLRRPGAGGGANDNKSTGIEAERRAISHFVRTGDEARIIEVRAGLSVGSDPDGGYFVMPALSAGMTKKLFDQTPMRQLGRVETITAGDAWEEPIDFDEPDAVWVGEKEARPATDTPQIGKLRVPVEEIYALQPVTQRLIDDVGFDLGGWVEGKVTDKFIRSEGTAFVSGNGDKKPFGFLSSSIVSTGDATRAFGQVQYIPGGDASLVTADGLKSLVWGVRAPYRAGSSWLMNSATAGAVDKLKATTTGEYLWRNGMTAGAPDTMLGYPVVISEDMPDMAGNAYPNAFGNWRLFYVIVDKAGIRFLRDPYSDKPNVQFYAYRRVGGVVANSEAVKLLKIATS
jgi:HK97 family phage major capsid protein